jgi:hypothetical protein
MNLRVSQQPSNPNLLHDPTFIGDYIGIAAGSDEGVHIDWGGVGALSGHPRLGLAVFEATLNYYSTTTESIISINSSTSTAASSYTALENSSSATASAIMTQLISPNNSNIIYAAVAVAGATLLTIVLISRRQNQR